MDTYHLPPDTTVYDGVGDYWTGLGRYAPKGIYTKANSFEKAVANIRFRVARLLGLPLYMIDVDPSDIEIE